LTVIEMARLLHDDYGVTDALDLDGGGSTTLVMDYPETHVVNVPVGSNNVPNSLRAVGSSLVIFAAPARRPTSIQRRE
jgi:exopolysaccharide biosynthesis protein